MSDLWLTVAFPPHYSRPNVIAMTGEGVNANPKDPMEQWAVPVPFTKTKGRPSSLSNDVDTLSESVRKAVVYPSPGTNSGQSFISAARSVGTEK